MTNYKSEYQDASTLDTAYPHDPVDFDASVADYLTAKQAVGQTFVGVIPNGSTAGHFIFTTHSSAADPTVAPVAAQTS